MLDGIKHARSRVGRGDYFVRVEMVEPITGPLFEETTPTALLEEWISEGLGRHPHLQCGAPV